MPGSAQPVTVQTCRSVPPLRSSQFPVQPAVSALPACDRAPAPPCPRNFPSANAPSSRNQVRTENTSAMKSAPFCCCCSPPQSATVLPRLAPHPVPASPPHGYQTVSPCPSARPKPSPRHSTAPRFHSQDLPCNPSSICPPARPQSSRWSYGNISGLQYPPLPPTSTAFLKSAPATPAPPCVPKYPRSEHPCSVRSA